MNSARHVLRATALLVLACPAAAQAQDTVQCVSRDYQYEECWAAGLQAPQLIHQVSSSPCTLNRSWGFNRRTGYIWVAQGCSGIFADASGYHHGRGDGFDPGARTYDQHGHDAGAVVAGAVIGAILGGAISSKPHKASNVPSYSAQAYSGCHGLGCLVDKPDGPRANSDDQFDTRPQFDKDGNPNFDTQGNYQGCRGNGCLVDNPDSPN